MRYRCMAARQGRRAAFGAIALLFVVAVLVLGEVAAWLALSLRFATIETTLILLGINLIIAVTFGLLAARSSPSRAEREALQVRQQSLDAARGALSIAALVRSGTPFCGTDATTRLIARSQPVVSTAVLGNGPSRCTLLHHSLVTEVN